MSTLPFKVVFMLWNAIPIYMTLKLIHKGYNLTFAIIGFILLIWVASTIGLFMQKKWSWFLALSSVAVLWILMFIQTTRRIIFVVANQSMEGPKGEGSPMAFIINFVFEQIFLFIPMTVLLILAISARRKIRDEIQK